MAAPRLEIDLNKIHHNTQTLVQRLASEGISVTGVTKASLGSAPIAHTLLQAGVCGLGDSRIENIESMRRANITAHMSLIRAPMLSQAKRVVQAADLSFNSELDIIKQLSHYAHELKRVHSIVLMLELGDLREGIMPEELLETVESILVLPNIELKGIGTNLACRCGVSPDTRNMAQLSELASQIETKFKLNLAIISGGNSANLPWILNQANHTRVNNLRLGESILLGREPLQRHTIEGLYTDAITLIAEVIESKIKPSVATGVIAQSAFGAVPAQIDQGPKAQSILAIGIQDIDPAGLTATQNQQILAASSDHLIIHTQQCLTIGSEMKFQLNYSALLRAMTSPFVNKTYFPITN